MKELSKYHKQTFPKPLKKELDRFNKKYNLKMDKDLVSYFYIMVFKTGLRNKNTIEKVFETFRNKHLDLWHNISFNERNLLFSHELDPIKAAMPQFEYEGSAIYIPFFDVLMNNLYDHETAILELPQFFKLYNDFESSIIDMKQYGMLPFIHNMSDLHYVCHNEEKTILYFDDTHTFYVLTEENVMSIPFYHKRDLSEAMRQTMGALLLEDASIEIIYEHAKKMKMLHPKLEKRILRREKV